MYQDICYQELAKAMEQLSSVSQSFQNSTQDSELLSRFNSYYTNLQFKYYYDALEIIELNTLSPALRNLNSSEWYNKCKDKKKQSSGLFFCIYLHIFVTNKTNTKSV